MRARLLVGLVTAALLAGLSNIALASSGQLKEVEFDQSQAARQRGAETVVGVCLMCHSLKYVKFGDLADIGMDKQKIQLLLTDQKLEDQMLSLTPLAVRKESYGKEPPDLSLMTVARKKGPQYVYTLLTSYYTDAEGNIDNHLFPGVKMPDMLGYSFATQGSAERVQIEAQTRDTVAFLMWAADPNADERRELGVYVIAYLVLLTTLLYLLKRRTWRDVR